MRTDQDRMEDRLRDWAHWLTLGSTGNGFSVVNVLHESWSPPSPGQLPTIKVGASDRRQRDTHAAVLQLSHRLQHTLQVHYCRRLAVADQAIELACCESTVHQRIRLAKLQLGVLLKA